MHDQRGNVEFLEILVESVSGKCLMLSERLETPAAPSQNMPAQIGKPHGWTSQELAPYHQLSTPFQGTRESCIFAPQHDDGERRYPICTLSFLCFSQNLTFW